MMNDSAPVVDYVTLNVEPFERFREEAADLLKAHWRELALYPDLLLDIDASHYRALEAQGRLMIVTVRVATQLCGYAVFLLGPHPHFGSLQAKLDVLYIAPPVRRLGLGRNLIRESEIRLK